MPKKLFEHELGDRVRIAGTQAEGDITARKHELDRNNEFKLQFDGEHAGQGESPWYPADILRKVKDN